MLLDKEIEVRLSGNNINHYETEGYKIPRHQDASKRWKVKLGTTIKVLISDLPIKSNVPVRVLCDYCKEAIIEVPYETYISNKQTINKDCCYKCKSLKVKESNKKNFGDIHPSHTEEATAMRKQTNIEKYGFDNPLKNKDIQNKVIETNLKKYGVEHTVLVEEFKLKGIETSLQKYGYESPNQADSVKNKKKITNLKNRGVEYPTQNKEVMNKIRKAITLTMYKNSTAPSSYQQNYLNNLLGGELNFAFEKTWVDIAYIDEKIYIEYDGSGHDLSVRLSNTTREKFDKNERSRYYALKNMGWKMIRIISAKDYMPSDEVVINMINYAKEFLGNNHSWIKFNIDDSTIITSLGIDHYDFGRLRKLNKAS